MGIQALEIRELLRTLFNKGKNSNFFDETHIKAGMKWLCRAQDMAYGGGVSIRFSLLRGWGSSYPETTGYIIPTFLRYYKITGDESFAERAIRMAEWELSIQQDNGSFIGGPLAKGLGNLAFDTGQIIFGFLSAFKYNNDERFLKAVVKAGAWLVDVQDTDGAWRNYSYNSIPHTYYSRVAWSLAELYKITGEDRYLDAAIRNIEWALSNQRSNGWFENAGFTLSNNKSPYTHTIAYTIRGILEVGMLIKEQKYINTVIRSIDAFLNIMNPEGFFWGAYDSLWRGDRSFSCLTGNAQLSIICSRLYLATNNDRYLDSAHLLNKYLRTKQDVETNIENIRGAVLGSWPIWGRYERFSYPNWATKFFVDALLIENEIRQNDTGNSEYEKKRLSFRYPG